MSKIAKFTFREYTIERVPEHYTKDMVVKHLYKAIKNNGLNFFDNMIQDLWFEDYSGSRLQGSENR